MKHDDLDVHLMRIRDVSDALNVSTSTVYRWIEAGKIPGVVRIGGTVRVHRQEFREWVAANAVRQEQPA